jgi:asparagine synthase (glutamine-hydrolysing)
MCGIAGELNFGSTPDDTVVKRMSDALAHRGPDGEGFFRAGPIALAHRRLAILDLTEAGAQPMVREGCTVVFNGEIYRHLELRHELERYGHRFTSRSDTEVILGAYLQWGEQCVERLDGMFAFALWDARSETLVLARDRAGKKPLHFALRTEGGWPDPQREGLPSGGVRMLTFGSEIKALLARGDLPREADPVALVRYLGAECIPGTRSAFAAVRKLPAAHVAVVTRQGFRLRRYWELPVAPRKPSPASDRPASEALIPLLEAAVARRLEADVPVGIFLSGGIDSSAILALAARHRKRIPTFSVAFEEPSFDESRYARLLAERLRTDHHEERLSATACVDLLSAAVDALDEPFADPSFLPTMLVSRFAQRSVKVVLTGDGGDEIFAGYDPFVAHRLARLLAWLPPALWQAVGSATSLLPTSSANMSLDFRLKRFVRGLSVPDELRHPTWLGSLQPRELRELVLPEFRASAESAELYHDALEDAAYDLSRGISPGSIEGALRYYFRRYLADDILVKADRAAMNTSLEVRSPFLDTEVVEWASRLPAGQKLSLTSTKVVLKDALQGIVPDEILTRPKKGFGIPVAAWIRGALRPLFEDLFSPESLRRSGLLQPEPTRALLVRHLGGKEDLRKPLWTIAMLLMWQRKWGLPHQ